MTSRSPRTLRLLLALCFLLHGCATSGKWPDIYERTTTKTVAETLEDVEFAITERNFRIAGQLHVGRGIRERDGTAFPDYEVVLFCNLGLARQMLELDPGAINFCPGRVAVRDAGGGTTVISAPLLPEPAAPDSALADVLHRINTHIREIVDYGTERWARQVP